MPQVTISDENFARLQSLAVPLVDTVDTVLAKALDALQGIAAVAEPKAIVRVFSSGLPPDLSFTTVRTATIDGQALTASETYWNSILIAVIRAAHAHGATLNQISKNLLANHIAGGKDDGGYKPVREVGLAVQGQDANNAWKSAAHLAEAFGITVDVVFVWQNNPKAAVPGQAGRLQVGHIDTR